MQVRKAFHFMMGMCVFAVFSYDSVARTSTKTISSNQTGKQGDYYYEYWKDNGTGTMTLGDGCNFSCQWGSVGNILFRKGIRPGSRKQVVTYSAEYKPTGNSYLSIYGWFKNPLVEYYIIESWGSWKPPGGAAKASVATDSGTYDIYQNQRTGPSIEGNKTFMQYWSVRRAKRTSGVITCANHFDAWEKAGMKIGTFYEVSFNVEAYQSGGGSADVKVSMDTVPPRPVRVSANDRAGASVAGVRGNGLLPIVVTPGASRTIIFNTPANGGAAVKVYNVVGREVAETGRRVYSAGQHTIRFEAPNMTSGVYFYAIKSNDGH